MIIIITIIIIMILIYYHCSMLFDVEYIYEFHGACRPEHVLQNILNKPPIRGFAELSGKHWATMYWISMCAAIIKCNNNQNHI